MERELTEDEKGLIACAIRHPGFPPKPEYLADCHRLTERGWLDRKLIHAYVTFWLSDKGAKALELDGALNQAMEATNRRQFGSVSRQDARMSQRQRADVTSTGEGWSGSARQRGEAATRPAHGRNDGLTGRERPEGGS